MARKSFGTQLFQGFVRSAVNQVGRDGGKVVSNKVYGDGHSTPIRIAAQKTPSNYYLEGEKISEEKVKPEFLSYSIGMYILRFIGSLIISPLAIIFHGVYAFQYFTKKEGLKVVTKKVENWVTDRRRKEGQRFEGYFTRTFYLETPADEEDLKIFRIKGLIHLILMGFFIFILAQIVNVFTQ